MAACPRNRRCDGSFGRSRHSLIRLLPVIPLQEMIDRGAVDWAESTEGVTNWHDGECADIARYAKYVFEFALKQQMPGGQAGTQAGLTGGQEQIFNRRVDAGGDG